MDYKNKCNSYFAFSYRHFRTHLNIYIMPTDLMPRIGFKWFNTYRHICYLCLQSPSYQHMSLPYVAKRNKLIIFFNLTGNNSFVAFMKKIYSPGLHDDFLFAYLIYIHRCDLCPPLTWDSRYLYTRVCIRV